MVPMHSSAVWAKTAPARGNPFRHLTIFAITAATLSLLLVRPPLLCAQAASPASSPPRSFEVASIKPNRSGDMRFMMMFQPGKFIANGVTLKGLIALAYGVKDFQISGGPNWVNTERYDTQAKEPDEIAEKLSNLPLDQRREILQMMVQSLLADRFQLKVSHESKELPVYNLVVAKDGPKLHEAKPGTTYTEGIKDPNGKPTGGGMMRIMPGHLIGQAIPMDSLLMPLSQMLGRTVLDRTGLKGKYDIDLHWTPDPATAGLLMGPPRGNPGPDAPPPPDSSGPSIFTAIQEQLGLKLESAKGPVDVLTIDHVERPSEN